MYKYTIRTEKVRPECSPRNYGVVIRDPSGDVHGIPIRGVRKDEAESLESVVLYAFEYGVDACREKMQAVILTAERVRHIQKKVTP